MTSLYRVTLPSVNLDESVSFYRKLLNIEGFRVSPGRHYFNCSGVTISCYDASANGDQKIPRANEEYIYFAVDDVDAVYRAAQEAGAAFDTASLPGVGVLGKVETRPWGERSFYTRDPSGNPLCFAQKETVFSEGVLPT